MSAAFEPTESRLETNGLEYHVLTWEAAADTPALGDVVLCHGYLDVAWSYSRVAHTLSQAGYRAIAFDWRGHGDSEHVGRGGYYHFPDYVLDLYQLLPQLSDDRVHLVGHSMGGTVCALYAGLQPGTLKTLTLIEGIGPPAHAPSIAPDRFGAFVRTVQKVRGRGERVMEDAQTALRRLRTTNRDLDDTLGELLVQKATRPATRDEGLVWRFDPLHQTTAPTPFNMEAFAAFLNRIEVPTLVVGGERGFRVPDEAARRAHIPDERLMEIPDVGHMIHQTAWQALASTLLDFFSECGNAPNA